jgi:hypothetical protein
MTSEGTSPKHSLESLLALMNYQTPINSILSFKLC